MWKPKRPGEKSPAWHRIHEDFAPTTVMCPKCKGCLFASKTLGGKPFPDGYILSTCEIYEDLKPLDVIDGGECDEYTDEHEFDAFPSRAEVDKSPTETMDPETASQLGAAWKKEKEKPRE